MTITLRQSATSQVLLIGPFVDETDGHTAETGLTINASDIRLSKNGANIVAKNSGGGTHDELGMYAITLDDTDTDTVGRLQLIVDVVGARPVYRDFIVLEEAVYDSFYAAGATSLSAKASSGGAVNISNTADNIDTALKSVSFVGVETSGTNSSINAQDNVYHQIDDTANAIDIVYEFDISGARLASNLLFYGYVSGSNDAVTIQAYNGAGWDTIGSIAGQSGITNINKNVPLLVTHTGTGADIGKVYIRFVCTGQSNPALYIDQALVQAVNIGQTIGYADGAIWVDTNNGTAGTEAFVNGVADNPADSWADALTISTNTGITRFRVKSGSAITLSSSVENYSIIGDGLFTLSLGGQSVTGAYIKQAQISGVSSGNGAIIEDCRINGPATIGPSYFVRSGFSVASGSIFTAASAGDYAFVDCVSLVSGSAQPYFDFSGTGSASSVDFRRWSGGINCTLDSDNIASFDIADGGTLSCVTDGASVGIRGITKAVALTVSASETVELVGITGHVTIAGAATAATVVVSGVVTDIVSTATNCTIDDNSISQASLNAQVALALASYDAATGTEIAAVSTKVTTIDSVVDTIQAKTDSLTFTVAGEVDANVKYVNDTQVSGTGGSGDEWGPV